MAERLFYQKSRIIYRVNRKKMKRQGVVRRRGGGGRGALFASSVSLKCGGCGTEAGARSRSFVFCALDWRQYSFIQPAVPRRLSLVAYNAPLTPAKKEFLTRTTSASLPPEVPTRRNRVASSVFSVARQAAKSLPALPPPRLVVPADFSGHQSAAGGQEL